MGRGERTGACSKLSGTETRSRTDLSTGERERMGQPTGEGHCEVTVDTQGQEVSSDEHLGTEG